MGGEGSVDKLFAQVVELLLGGMGIVGVWLDLVGWPFWSWDDVLRFGGV